MEVTLIGFTQNPDRAVAEAAVICHAVPCKDPFKTVNFLLQRQHFSPFEHADFRFEIRGVSRALSHQLVRHRIASMTQESQRFVSPIAEHAITPPSVRKCGKTELLFQEALYAAFAAFKELKRLGIPEEDARYLLPAATETKLIVTMNARSLFNFFELRCCMRAQWEIRELAEKMLVLVKNVAPAIFARAGKTCENGKGCREGEYCRVPKKG